MSWTKLRATVAGGVVLAALAACTGGGAGDPAAQDGDGTLRYLIAQPEDSADLKKIKKDIARFESQNEGITVELSSMPTETMRTVLQTQLRSGKGPDVFSYDTGPGFAGVLAKAGLLHDLTDAYQKYDWPIYPSAKERVTFDGKLLGVPDQLEEVGIYYNKKLLPDQPKNLGELDRAMAKLKSSGVTPMAFGNKEAWPAGHLLSAALSSRIGAERMTALLQGTASWDDPEVTAAIKTVFVDFAKRGYLPKSPNAITYDNANSLFYSGKAAMNPTGTWMTSEIDETAKFPVGFMPFPAPDGPGIFTGGLGSGTFVSANTKESDAALKLLDYLHSKEHGRWQVETFQTIPAYPVDTKGLKVSPLFAQILEDTGRIAAGEGEFGANIDVLAPEEFNKAMYEGLQGVLAGRTTPEEAAKSLQTAFEQPKEN